TAFGIRPTAPFDQIVFYQRIAGSHPANTLDAAVAEDVAAQYLRGTGVCRTGAVAIADDIDSTAIGPFEYVVFQDPVIAARQRDHAKLREGIGIAGMLECDPLHPDVADPTTHRDEGVLTGRNLDQVIG